MNKKRTTQKPDRQKAKELILYIAQKSEKDPTFGATKLQKQLFVSDFVFYGLTGKSITGLSYRKLKHGPVMRDFPSLAKELVEKERQAVYQIKESFGYPQERLIALRDADLSKFNAEEIDTIHSVIDDLKDANATELSKFTHALYGWIAARDEEDIPYETIFVTGERLTEEDIQFGRELEFELKSTKTTAH